MEYAKNGDMLNYIQNVGAMPIVEVKRCFAQLCQAVRYCHSNNICHRQVLVHQKSNFRNTRDIKPEGVMSGTAHLRNLATG